LSKIEVDTIDKQSGSTLTLGGSGTAVTLASGATQTGFGRTGTVDWQTASIKTSTFTAASGEGYFANTAGGAFNMNLPAGSAGAIVSVADYSGTFQTNNLTVVPNGSDKIGSVNENSKLSTEGQSVTFVFVDSTQGWINTMDSTSNVRGAAFICASVSGSGNTLATAPDCANVKIATFTGPGNFTVNSASSTADDNIVSYMIVAGGGGGAGASGCEGGGGGGAGGFREVVSPSAPYTGSPLNGYSTPANRATTSAQAYPIVVGGGGAGGAYRSDGVVGSVSSGLGITSAGGGKGSDDYGGGGPCGVGGSGGSGGGSGAQFTPTGGSGNTPPTSPAQGKNGGAGGGGAPFYGGGGGGGASVVGNAGRGTSNGYGGNGVSTNITASPVAYAGGGGGGSHPNGSPSCGGTGGGGNGSDGPGTSTAGGTNKGGGGGGKGGPGPSGAEGKAGGSGIVIIRYKFQ